MIFRTANGAAQVEQRASEFGTSVIPIPGSGFRSFAGRAISVQTAMGLPALSAAVRLVAEGVASLPIRVMDGNRRAVGSIQWQLLHERPNTLPQSPFDFVQQIVAALETSGNALIHKVKDRRGKLAELYVLDPDMCRIRRDPDTGEKKFDVMMSDTRIEGMTTAGIIHIMGYSPPGSIVGMSPIMAHRNALGNSIALVEYQGRFWSQDARPGLVLKIPGNLGSQQAKAILETWVSQHGSLQNAHRPAVLAGGADLQTIPISLNDAQFAEQTRMSVRDIANIMRVPENMLNSGDPLGKTAEEDSLRFLLWTLTPRLRRIEQGLAADDDLFGNTSMRPVFDTSELMRADAKTRSDFALKYRQAGILTANELRQVEGYPPVAGGDDLQMTPVGGAPNAPSTTGGSIAAE